MAGNSYCPWRAVEGGIEKSGCMGEACGVWDGEGKCCSIKTIAEFQRLGTARGIAALDQLQSSLDARLGDLLYKLERLLVEPR